MYAFFVLSEVEEAGLIMAAVQSTVKTESVSYDVTSCMPSSPCTSATCNMDILQPMAGKNGLFYVFKRNVELTSRTAVAHVAQVRRL